MLQLTPLRTPYRYGINITDPKAMVLCPSVRWALIFTETFASDAIQT